MYYCACCTAPNTFYRFLKKTEFVSSGQIQIVDLILSSTQQDGKADQDCYARRPRLPLLRGLCLRHAQDVRMLPEFLTSNSRYMPDLGIVSHPLGLKEVHEAHQRGPGHLESHKLGEGVQIIAMNTL